MTRFLSARHYGRDGHGRNLGDRWPRSIAVAVEKAEKRGQDSDQQVVSTLSPAPTGAPSITSTPTSTPVVSRTIVAAESKDQTQRTSSSGDGKYTGTPAEPKAKTIRGVSVPAKPAPPGPEDCCMSGCARCVYDLYAEDLQDFHADLTEARNKLLALSPPIQREEWDQEALGAYPKASDSNVQTGAEGNAVHRDRAQSEVDAVISGLDPTMKAFLEMERAIKKRQAQQNA